MSTESSSLSSQIAAIRARLVALDDAHAAGALDDAAYQAARREAEHALGDAVLAAPTPADTPPVRPAKPSGRLVVLLGLVVVIVAVGGYAFTGSPSLAGLGSAPVAADSAANSAAGSDREVGVQQIAEMVDRLAARLKERPDDAEGWTMLARSYAVLGRYRDALPAYRRAVELQPKDAGLLADYADTVTMTNDGKANAESIALIDRALALDPAQPKALALAGTVAFERGDYGTAVAQWQKIADALPPDSEFHRQVIANIDEARRRGAGGGNSAAPSASSATKSVADGREALTGTVSLAPGLAASASPDDTVFVLARPESGRMPLAVFRATVKDLPLRFRLDDSMAMTPTMKISDMKLVVVAARISKSGNALSRPGDLLGQTGPVAPGTHDLAIEIKDVVPSR
jgi:cytochrome c-type biogenesis protein CcmH